MKAFRKLVVLLSLGVLATVYGSSTEAEHAYLESCNKDPGTPVPVSVVTPTVSPEYNGTQVKLEFVVDAKGNPAEFSIKSAPDDVLAKTVVEAVKKWRFQPALIDGTPVATRVVLPVRIVDADEATANTFAALR